MPRAHKKFYATGDHPCYFCGELITERGRTRMSLVRHHLNHDSTDDREENIVPCHRLCHERHHKTGKPKSETERANLSKALKGLPKSPEHRSKLSAANKGKKCPAVAESNRRRARESNRQFRSEHHRIERKPNG